MFLFPLMKKRSAANPLAALRGLVWATDFTEGADAQVVYNTLEGDTIGTGTAIRGTTSGSEASDFAWGSAGAEWTDGDERVTSYPDTLDFIEDGVYSLHFRIYVSNTATDWPLFSSAESNWSKGTNFCLYSGGEVYVITNYNLGFTYHCTPTTSWKTVGWHSVSFTSDGTTVRVYVDGVAAGTMTGNTGTTKQTDRTKVVSGYSSGFGTQPAGGAIMRAFLACNVEHDASEVADIHTLMAALPNAA